MKLFSVLLAVFLLSFGSHCAGLPVSDIDLPEGFSISVYTDKVPGARQMTLGSGNTVYVGTRAQGCVYAVLDRNNDGKADSVFKVIDGLYMPNGVAYRKGDLYIAEVGRIIKIRNIGSLLPELKNRALANAKYEVVNDSFSANPYHGWKYIAFGPDDHLYVPVGVPFNVGLSKDKRFGTIMRMAPDGSDLKVIASGIRNTVGFDWDPRTKKLWFTDNGRDWLGDDAPPDELNRMDRFGMDFGFPYVHGKSLLDPEYGKGREASEFAAPQLELPAHSAALGMKFYSGRMFPKSYLNTIFIAEHGSWNRSEPVGYQIVAVNTSNGQASSRVFASGWLSGGKAWGRPVDVLVMPDGALLVSDDKAGAIYRISYSNSR